MYRMFATFTIFVVCPLLTVGCTARPSPVQQAKVDRFNVTIPTCEGEADCKTKWEAAQLWVVHNAGYKIQTATSVLIETYNPSQYSSSLAARVTKEPLGGGKYKIVIFVWCNNSYGCRPNGWDAAIDFNEKVSAAVP